MLYENFEGLAMVRYEKIIARTKKGKLKPNLLKQEAHILAIKLITILTFY